jgi:hypothetical protein
MTRDFVASAYERIADAKRALVLGIGGGGDVVGALAVGRLSEALGTPFALGGVAWERMPVDPHPGPRALSEVRGGRRLGEGAALIDPAEGATTPEGVPFSESAMAGFLGEPAALIDVSRGPAVAAAGIAAAARELGCDLAIHVDVGGDVLARGDEPGLASPLCDAIMLAAACLAAPEVPGVLAVLGPGCDGELTAAEVFERLAPLAGAGGWLGTASVTPEIADELAQAAGAVVTEASLQVARCARGEVGQAAIRGGRRTVTLGPLGALCLFLDPEVTLREGTPLARAVAETKDIEQGRAAIADLGVRTELDYERSQAREGP